MPVRLRKLIGAFGLVAFVIAYAATVVTLVDRTPDLWWVRMIFFIVTGAVWGAPILPLLKWMNGPPDATS